MTKRDFNINLRRAWMCIGISGISGYYMLIFLFFIGAISGKVDAVAFGGFLLSILFISVSFINIILLYQRYKHLKDSSVCAFINNTVILLYFIMLGSFLVRFYSFTDDNFFRVYGNCCIFVAVIIKFIVDRFIRSIEMKKRKTGVEFRLDMFAVLADFFIITAFIAFYHYPDSYDRFADSLIVDLFIIVFLYFWHRDAHVFLLSDNDPYVNFDEILFTRKGQHGIISKIECPYCGEKWVVDESNMLISDEYKIECPLCNAELVRVVH